ncbi:MAG: amidase [Anaerolineales bacterium]|nr:amidase [Anaerolineales bacterium]
MTKLPFTSLATLANELRTGKRPLLDFIDELAAYFAQREPDVLAFVPENGRFDRLRQDAKTLLEQYPDPDKRPLLFGIPIGVKDIFHTDGFVTQAGCNLPADVLQGKEAVSVTQLKKAGALILGKTVTTEFAYFAPGPTRNPHNIDHTPGGSSSGSAAAVGAWLAPLTFGTQTIGSINRPAAYCGVVGYKPSYDRISRQGVIPLSKSADHIGLFSPDVTGIEMAAGVLCSHWQFGYPGRKPVFGVPEGRYLDYVSPEGRSHFRQVCKKLHDAGFAVKSVLALTDFDHIYERHNLIVAAEAARFHQPWYAQYGRLYHAKTTELIKRGQMVSDQQLQKARAGRSKLRDELSQLMNKNSIDIMLSPPAQGPAPLGLSGTGNPVMNLPWTHSGLPTLSLPAGFNEAGLPLGLQLTGRWYEDEAMLGWADEIAEIVNH